MSEHKNLRRAFKRLDTQRKGYLGVGDFKKALTSCGIQCSNEDFYHLLCEFDHHMRGRISYKDFLKTFIDVSWTLSILYSELDLIFHILEVYCTPSAFCIPMYEV